MKDWLQTLPKAELHLHIEGTLEPELMFELAARNDVALPYDSIEEVRAAYNFANLQSFLDLYYQGMNVLHTEQDFFDLAMAYFERAHQDGVVHVELSFDPQPHLSRGVAMRTLFAGLGQAREEASRRFGMSTALIMSFLRDRSADDAMDVLEQAAPWYDQIDAIGLDSAELGNPPEKFTAVFEQARMLGIARLAHAGEEGPAAYISGALDALDVCRIDHGVRCLEDEALTARLANEQIPLTVCPLSNVYLKVFERLEDHTLPALLDQGLCVTLNSDDPAYFGGGMLNNFMACHDAFGWDEDAFRVLARNAIEAAFMDENRRETLLQALADC
ncbi:adenosine deaminase [Kushneria indalinina]|uniref:Adenine deaminase n=1 Tax=Kushneria indalinina DSM 14324 TaxID=1122140 RepID=A0A3D9DU22_9GAMM|nr:adenosine deaminase [Kushneria indalinina]REC94232.1 adenosine deaminase [Kushneria indalinina DSM 14324]